MIIQNGTYLFKSNCDSYVLCYLRVMVMILICTVLLQSFLQRRMCKVGKAVRMGWFNWLQRNIPGIENISFCKVSLSKSIMSLYFSITVFLKQIIFIFVLITFQYLTLFSKCIWNTIIIHAKEKTNVMLSHGHW
jgi:hypothetical protein